MEDREQNILNSLYVQAGRTMTSFYQMTAENRQKFLNQIVELGNLTDASFQDGKWEIEEGE